jgi:hypothetical protein
MKRKCFAILFMLFVLVSTSVFGQEDGSETFNAIRDAIKPSLPAAFVVNTGQTTDSRFAYRFTYDENASETNRLIFNLVLNSEGFSEMDLAMGSEQYTLEGRDVLFSDGSETGMSGISLILKNKAKFIIHHRDFKTFKPRDKTDLENMLSSIDIETLESLQ